MSITTPRKIDYNGIEIASQDKLTSIVATAISSLEGINLNYNDGSSKTFTINTNGFTLSANTTSFSLISMLQQLLSALSTPPNTSTLLVQNKIQIVDGSNTVNIDHSNPSILTIDCPGGQTIFQQIPQSLAGVTGANDLTRKSYVDALNTTRGTIVDGPTATGYLLWGGATGNGLYTGTDFLTNGIRYIPLNGSIQGQYFRVEGVNSRVRWGSTDGTGATRGQAFNVLFGDGMITTNDPSINPTQINIFGWNSGVTAPAGGLVAIGNEVAQLFSNPGATGTSSSQNVVAIGKGSAQTNPSRQSVYIGYEAGNYRASPQRTPFAVNEVNIGYQAGYTYGDTTGPNFGVNIGYKAGYTTTKPYIAGGIGTVCINADSTALNTGSTDGTYIAPIKGYAVAGITGGLMYDFDASVTGVTGMVYYSTN